jgi:glutamate-1-semialdehyde 2,1-aminomutase
VLNDHHTAIASALAEAKSRYIVANARSQEQHRKAAQVLPGGNTRTVLFSEPFPITLARGHGCRITSLDGRDYIDFLGDYTAGLYGHSHPVLRAAVLRALDHGWVMGGHIQLEEELARLICDRVPSIELVRFTNSGTEANLFAISAARAIMGRNKIVVFEGAYHGGVFMFGGKPSPLAAPFDFVKAPYNDVEAALALLDEAGPDVAAIVIEPMQGSAGCIPADPAFLHALRDWATKRGALLIFDEVMTSRLAPGGLQAVLGIVPDMTTLGKYVGGGLSFGAFGGRVEVMRRFDPLQPDALAHAGTFNNNIFTLSAGVAGLRDVYTSSAALALNARGEALRARLNTVAKKANFAMQFTGIGSMMNVHMCAGSLRSIRDLEGSNSELLQLFYFSMLDNGIWLARRGMINLSLPIGDAECDQLISAVESFVTTANSLIHE